MFIGQSKFISDFREEKIQRQAIEKNKAEGQEQNAQHPVLVTRPLKLTRLHSWINSPAREQREQSALLSILTTHISRPGPGKLYPESTNYLQIERQSAFKRSRRRPGDIAWA